MTELNHAPLRVLHVIDSLGLGGAQSFLLNLLPAFDASEFEFLVVALHGPGVMEEQFRSAGLTVCVMASSKFDPRILLRMRRVIGEFKPDVVHAHLVPSCAICETWRCRLRIPRLISHMHSLFGRHDAFPYQNLLERCIYRKTDLVLGCSVAVFDGMAQPAPRAILHNCVDVERFRPLTAGERRAAREELGFAESDFVVGSVGRMIPQKNFGMLCEGIGALRAEAPEIRGLIVGSGPLESDIRALSQSIDGGTRIRITGYREDVSRLLSAMDLFVLPSTAEGLGLAAIEAMACGVPCALADFSAAREVVSSDAEGLVFPRGDANELRKAIRMLYKDVGARRRLAEAGPICARKRFSARAAADKLRGIYQSMLTD